MCYTISIKNKLQKRYGGKTFMAGFKLEKISVKELDRQFKKELVDKYAKKQFCRELNAITGVDIQQDIYAAKITGVYTFKSLAKELPFTPESFALVFIKDEDDYGCVKLYADGSISLTLDHKRMTWRGVIDYFYSKKNVNQQRKDNINQNIASYVVVIRPEQIKSDISGEPFADCIDKFYELQERVVLKGKKEGYYPKMEMYGKDISRGYDRPYNAPSLSSDDFHEKLIDKSGYYLWEARERLQERLRVLKSNKRTKEVSKFDFTPYFEQLECTYNDLRNCLVTNYMLSDNYGVAREAAYFVYRMAEEMTTVGYYKNQIKSQVSGSNSYYADRSVEYYTTILNNMQNKLHELYDRAVTKIKEQLTK